MIGVSLSNFVTVLSRNTRKEVDRESEYIRLLPTLYETLKYFMMGLRGSIVNSGFSILSKFVLTPWSLTQVTLTPLRL